MKVIITNTEYPPAAIEKIVRWAAAELEVSDYVEEVKVTNYRRGSARGRCWGRRVLIRIGSPDSFPVPPISRFKSVPPVAWEDWREALVCLAAHEFQHSRQHRARDRARALREDPYKVRMSEVDADRAEVWLLAKYRGETRPALDEEIRQAVEREQTKAAERRERSAARSAAERDPINRAAKVITKIQMWERKLKTAQTYLKKYKRRLARLERGIKRETSS